MTGVFCLGIATLDYVYGVDTIPSRPEKHRARDLVVVGGGCAGNASVGVARLGAKAWLATRLGDDLTGDRIVADLEGEGVDTSPTLRLEGIRSPVSAIFVDAAGERLVMSYTDPALPEDAGRLPAALPQGTGAVLADIRWVEGARAIFRKAREAGVPAVLDADRKPPHPELVSTATHVAFSAQALQEASGVEDPRQGLARLARETDTWLAVTLGHEGVLFWEKGEIVHIPAFQIEAVDTLGAGDIWHGAFALALAEGQDERGAIRFASAVAGIKCTRFGGRAGTPNREEVERFLAANP